MYVNHPRTYISLAMDQPLKEAKRQLELAWKGEDFRNSIKVKWAERSIEGCGHLLCRQCDETLTLRWQIPARECVDEDRIRRAADGH